METDTKTQLMDAVLTAMFQAAQLAARSSANITLFDTATQSLIDRLRSNCAAFASQHPQHCKSPHLLF